MMEYMLKMGEFTPQEKAMERKAAMGDQLRADAGDGSGIMDAGRLKPFSLAKGLGDMANKVAGGYLKGKAGRESDAIGGNKSNAMKGLAKKMGFGGTSGAEDFSKGWNAENYG